MSDHTLPLTGERTVSGVAIETYWFARHVAAYRFAAGRRHGLRVLDAGCGEGYGTAMLAAGGGQGPVLGVDLDGAVVAHARRAYPGVEFAEADVGRLPLPDATFDAVVSLQVVEHLPDVGSFLAEAARVLRPGGEFLCAAPNRLTFSPGGGPVNPFHVREYAPAELAALLRAHFRVKALLGVHHGPRIRAVERTAARPFAELLTQPPPDEWPRWLRAAVARVRPTDFVLRADRLDESLDLMAVAGTPGF
ncbi:MAG: class I SAM-dependent methyltransferase [Egibacteraceae bacterium]